MASAPVPRSRLRYVLESAEGVLLALLIIPFWPLLRLILNNWGARPQERRGPWPGDRLVGTPKSVYTRAVSVDATAESLWPWLVQFGLGKAGFYSYELLERIVGIPVTNVESVISEHQNLGMGDEVLLHPDAPGVSVADISENERICFAHDEDAPGERPDPARSWSLYLNDERAGGSRLVLRTCIEPLREPSLRAKIQLAFEAPIDFLMEQRMLRSIRRLAALPARQA